LTEDEAGGEARPVARRGACGARKSGGGVPPLFLPGQEAGRLFHFIRAAASNKLNLLLHSHKTVVMWPVCGARAPVL